MTRGYYSPTRKMLLSSHLLHLSSLDVDDSGGFSFAVKNTIKMCLSSGATMQNISDVIGRSPEEIENLLEEP